MLPTPNDAENNVSGEAQFVVKLAADYMNNSPNFSSTIASNQVFTIDIGHLPFLMTQAHLNKIRPEFYEAGYDVVSIKEDQKEGWFIQIKKANQISQQEWASS